MKFLASIIILLFVSNSAYAHYCYNVKYPEGLRIRSSNTSSSSDCGVVGVNAKVRKVGRCRGNWCQVITPQSRCRGKGWIYAGPGSKNVTRYSCPHGRDITESARRELAPSVMSTAPEQPTIEVRNESPPVLPTRREISRPTPTPVAPRLDVPSLHSPERARRFVAMCERAGVSRKLCSQATSPNTNSRGTFNRVYGSRTPFHLLPPDRDWDKGIKLIKAVDKAGGCINELRNWYRPNSPKDYNRAAKGARNSTHVSASALDINYCSNADKNRALAKFRRMRRETGVPTGIGHYYCKSNRRPTNTIHIAFSSENYYLGVGC